MSKLVVSSFLIAVFSGSLAFADKALVTKTAPPAQNHHCRLADGTMDVKKTHAQCTNAKGTWAKDAAAAAKTDAPKPDAPKANAPKTDASKPAPTAPAKP